MSSLSLLESSKKFIHMQCPAVEHSINCAAIPLISHHLYCFLSQVLRFFCDSCSVPICRECSLGRHAGHSFTYLQEALQDSRALTIQLLADAQQGRQAIQVSGPTVSNKRTSAQCFLILLGIFFLCLSFLLFYLNLSVFLPGATRLPLASFSYSDHQK